ncbi:spermidine synthase [Erythrobacter sp. HKB08]|uniref:spermidine synthase n=1 Tax=Erythrobacter sp. HKB08 TaxID=2502843 RepID=UPI001008AB14|nr:fused MFS/spermidine synthase [Erythrobacter sp. HKB08]
MFGPARLLFTVTILTGSFLLFLVQPLVARMALPLLGGAPNVWNSAMLVYQALLLGGYAYAHALSTLPIRRQAMIHLALLLVAVVFLPITLAELPPSRPGLEALWVPALFALTIGPLFFLVSAQAPLMQRWYAADGKAGDPYWLYAASNVGSFAGLLSYPLLFEPNMPLDMQSGIWAAGYGLLILLVALAAWSRWKGEDVAAPVVAEIEAEAETGNDSIGWRTIALWLALSAVPSGLMLSTTTHLTTDIVAMPLLWVIPLGLYLLSFSLAFAEKSNLADLFVKVAPVIILFAGSLAMLSKSLAGFSGAIASILLLFVVAVALHRRLFALRPAPEKLTLFYLMMSAGGALGGLFTALFAPLIFDWVWEHPILVLAAAALLPALALFDWQAKFGIEGGKRRIATIGLVVLAAILAFVLVRATDNGSETLAFVAMAALFVLGALAIGKRWAFVAVLLALMVGRGGAETLETSFEGARERSYFGIYRVQDNAETGTRDLAHGTTLHGRQFLDAERRLDPTSYYGPTGGVGLALRAADAMHGPDAKIGIVGLGVGTLACYRTPDQDWTLYEIDPVVLGYSTAGQFSFLDECAPDAENVIGDARLELEKRSDEEYDVLVIDAFSSDSIPLHLLTSEALDIYRGALAENGVLVFHISNRYIDLDPVMAAHAEATGWSARIRRDAPKSEVLTASEWVVMARDKSRLTELEALYPDAKWSDLPAPKGKVWTDDHASILPHLRWGKLTGE